MAGLRPNSIAVVLGTRPEIIKLGNIIRLLGPAAQVIHTGQHYDAKLSEVFFQPFGLSMPTEVIGVGGRSRGEQIGSTVSALDERFARDRPDAVVVQGDTNSTLAAALAANAREIPLVHVEAGLRSFDRAMPEEHNRVLTDHLADLCLAPTSNAATNLSAEGIPEDRVLVTGNTIVEAVTTLLPSAEERGQILERHQLASTGYVLSTFHRPENVDDAMTLATIVEQLGRLSAPVLLPMHPRTSARMEREGIRPPASISVVAPLPYPEFLGLLAECALVIGDSGGLQEEVSILKRPMLVVRRSTERPEVVGTFARLAPPGPGLATLANGWLQEAGDIHTRLSRMASPFGDGSASQRSVDAVDHLLRPDRRHHQDDLQTGADGDDV